MARYTGPKVKLSRKVGVPIVDIPKHTAKRQLNPPGMHGYRGRRLRDYGIRLNEKQKLRYHYGVLERQFRRYMAEAQRSRGNTGERLMQLLETRLDNVVRRAGVVRTVWASRQLVAHGHVKVNGRKVDRPSYELKVGDVVTFKPKVHALLKDNMESIVGHNVSEWIEFTPAELTIRILAVPSSEQVPFDINTNLIIEFYR
jgi:small subunit ribosomal protein S4